jgi:hypothetical protein
MHNTKIYYLAEAWNKIRIFRYARRLLGEAKEGPSRRKTEKGG